MPQRCASRQSRRLASPNADQAFFTLEQEEPTIIRTLGLLTSLTLLAGCGRSSTAEDVGTKDATSKFAGLAFAVTPTLQRESTKLLYNNFADGTVTDLSTGEAGDVFLTTVGKRVVLFNRAETNLNFRSFDPQVAGAAPSAQLKTPATSGYDPVAALELGDDRVLLANYSANRIVVMKPSDGSIVQEVTAEWDLGASGILRPVSFHQRTKQGGAKEVYVLNGGLDANFQPDGTQQIFVLTDDGTTLAVVDIDTAAAKVQGIKLKLERPIALFAANDADKPFVATLCNAFSAAACTAGFERVDLAARTTEVAWEFTDPEYRNNGGMVEAKGGIFYASVGKPSTDGSFTISAPIVMRYDVGAQTSAVFHTYSAGSSGSWALGYDLTSDKLYVGDQKGKDGSGTFTIYDETRAGAGPTSLAISGIPIMATFVPD